MPARFTNTYIKNLKPREERYEVSEVSGLRIRVTPNGKVTWSWRYRFDGRPRNMTFGNYPGVSLADARVKLTEAQKRRDRGEDPGLEAVDTRRRRRQAETVDEMVQEYLKRYARPRKRSAGEDERILDKDVKPKWGKRKADSITAHEVVTLINSIVDRGAPVQANRTLTVVKKLFAFGVSQHFVPESPAERVARPTDEKLRVRDRILSEAEIPVFWHGLDDAKMEKATRLALKLILVTAQRPGEVAGAAKSEFNADKTEWLIPAARAKNRTAHLVPVSDLARDLIEQAFKLDADSAHLFPPGRAKGKRPHLAPSSIDHALKRCLPDLKLEDGPDVSIGNLTPHDLRRTAASKMTELGHLRLIVDKLLNHLDPTVGAVYDRYDYWAEKTAALQDWATELRRLVSGADNVVRLRRPAAND